MKQQESTGAESREQPPSDWRAFYVAWAGQLTSSLGGPFQTIALGIWALESGHGPSGLSWILAAGTLSQLAGALLGGPLVDRFGALRTVAVSDLVRFLLAVVLGCLVWGSAPLHWIILITAVTGCISGAFLPALRALAPAFLAEADLPRGNSFFELAKNASMLGGSLLGGITLTLTGPVAAIAINAASFAVGGIGAALAARSARSLPQPAQEPMLASLTAGIRYTLTARWLLILIGIDAVMDFVTAGQLSVGLPAIAQDLGGGAALGVLFASFGGGSVIGAWLAPRVRPGRLGPARAVLILHLLQAPLLAALPVSQLPVGAACLVVMGVLNGIAVVIYMSIIQRVAPSAMLGRVMSLLVFAGLSLQPLGQLSTGWSIEAGWLTASFVIAASIMAITSAVALTSKTLRDL